MKTLENHHRSYCFEINLGFTLRSVNGDLIQYIIVMPLLSTAKAEIFTGKIIL